MRGGKKYSGKANVGGAKPVGEEPQTYSRTYGTRPKMNPGQTMNYTRDRKEGTPFSP